MCVYIYIYIYIYMYIYMYIYEDFMPVNTVLALMCAYVMCVRGAKSCMRFFSTSKYVYMESVT